MGQCGRDMQDRPTPFEFHWCIPLERATVVSSQCAVRIAWVIDWGNCVAFFVRVSCVCVKQMAVDGKRMRRRGRYGASKRNRNLQFWHSHINLIRAEIRFRRNYSFSLRGHLTYRLLHPTGNHICRTCASLCTEHGTHSLVPNGRRCLSCRCHRHRDSVEIWHRQRWRRPTTTQLGGLEFCSLSKHSQYTNQVWMERYRRKTHKHRIEIVLIFHLIWEFHFIWLFHEFHGSMMHQWFVVVHAACSGDTKRSI